MICALEGLKKEPLGQLGANSSGHTATTPHAHTALQRDRGGTDTEHDLPLGVPMSLSL